jgi:hypothetical protein
MLRVLLLGLCVCSTYNGVNSSFANNNRCVFEILLLSAKHSPLQILIRRDGTTSKTKGRKRCTPINAGSLSGGGTAAILQIWEARKHEWDKGEGEKGPAILQGICTLGAEGLGAGVVGDCDGGGGLGAAAGCSSFDAAGAPDDKEVGENINKIKDSVYIEQKSMQYMPI